MAACSFSLGCGVSKSEAPLPDSTMVNVLADIHIAEAYSTSLPAAGEEGSLPKDEDSLALWYKQILTKHKLTLPQFEEAMVFYGNDPERMDSVYQNMILKLTADEERVGK